MQEAYIAQIAMSVFNIICVVFFGRYLLARFEEMSKSIGEIKTDIAVLKREREILNQVCPIRKEHL